MAKASKALRAVQPIGNKYLRVPADIAVHTPGNRNKPFLVFAEDLLPGMTELPERIPLVITWRVFIARLLGCREVFGSLAGLRKAIAIEAQAHSSQPGDVIGMTADYHAALMEALEKLLGEKPVPGGGPAGIGWHQSLLPQLGPMIDALADAKDQQNELPGVEG